jgi:hypothetical protein
LVDLGGSRPDIIVIAVGFSALVGVVGELPCR